MEAISEAMGRSGGEGMDTDSVVGGHVTHILAVSSIDVIGKKVEALVA